MITRSCTNNYHLFCTDTNGECICDCHTILVSLVEAVNKLILQIAIYDDHNPAFPLICDIGDIIRKIENMELI